MRKVLFAVAPFHVSLHSKINVHFASAKEIQLCNFGRQLTGH